MFQCIANGGGTGLMGSYHAKLCATLASPYFRKEGYAAVPKRLHGVENREANGILIDVVRHVKGRGDCGS